MYITVIAIISMGAGFVILLMCRIFLDAPFSYDVFGFDIKSPSTLGDENATTCFNDLIHDGVHLGTSAGLDFYDAHDCSSL